MTRDRLSKGSALLEKYASTFAAIEREYGVQGPVIVALWGLETDYGGFMGNTPLQPADTHGGTP